MALYDWWSLKTVSIFIWSINTGECLLEVHIYNNIGIVYSSEKRKLFQVNLLSESYCINLDINIQHTGNSNVMNLPLNFENYDIYFTYCHVWGSESVLVYDSILCYFNN